MNRNSIVSKAEQVGGNHYTDTAATCPHCRGDIQHWDLYANAPGLIYSATKHITRHRVKNGRQDLEKAITEIHKIIEQEYAEPAKAAPADREHSTSAKLVAAIEATARWRSYAAQLEKRYGVPAVAGDWNRLDEAAPHYGWPTPEIVDTSPEAARARADEFARGQPSDVPVGWVLEEVHGRPEMWHYRSGDAGNWGAEYSSRGLALRSLVAHIAHMKTAAASK